MDIWTWTHIDLRVEEHVGEYDPWPVLKVPTEELRVWLKQNVLSTDWTWDIYRYSVVGVWIMDPTIAMLFKIRFGV
jgi:hypothetical protein